MKVKKKRPTLTRSIFKAPDSITLDQERTFHAMKERARKREKYGLSVKTRKIHVIILICTLIFSITANNKWDEKLKSDSDKDDSKKDIYFIIINVDELVILISWVLSFIFISAVIRKFKLGKFKTPFYLMWVYIPFVHVSTFYIGLKEVRSKYDWWRGILISFFICEAIVIVFVICREIFYSIIIKSRWFRKNIGVTYRWSIQIIAPWTLAYHKKWARWGNIYTCMYDGETGENDLPHGTGRWFDDIYGGEILSGRWEKGVPVAPFVSRTYGQGDGFAALQIAVFVARDDNFDQSSGTPSNENPPKIGVATVECSVNGNFYSHLPLVKEGKPILVSSEENSVADICKKLVHLEVDDNTFEDVEIRVDASRRLEVRGHVYTPRTESLRSQVSDQIIVNVHRHNKYTSPSFTRKSQFMPRVSSTRNLFAPLGSTRRLNSIMILEDISEENEVKFLKSDVEHHENNSEEAEVRLRMPNAKRLQMKEVQFHISDDESEDSIITEEETGLHMPTDERNHSFNKSLKVAKLEVRDWTRNRLKEALIFFPGFNSSIEKSLKSFGQFMALAKLDSHVYPVLYAWPAGTILSYRAASDISATQKNKDNFTLLLRGLSDAGIHTVHLMGHSMGSQSLLAMFEDKHDSNVPSRSDASLMFQHDPAFCDNTDLQGTDEQLMVCKNIILMNPDFPVEAFVDRAFLSIRRVCQNITMLGDRNDIALRAGSKFFNGLYNKKGYMQPHLLRSDKSLKNYTKEFHYLTMGIDIELLYFSEVDGDMNLDQERLDTESGEKKPLINNALLFDSEAPIQATPGESDIEKQWLDIDVIDTTSLDTNIAGVRHGGFSVNPIMIKDLKELIVDGDRARLRSSLLKREGNIHTYSHAPAHVTL